MGLVVTPRIRCARCLPVVRCRCHVICLRVAFCHVIICISYHVILCITFAYVFVSCIRAFSPLSVLQSDTPMSSDAPFCLFSCVGVKLSRNGPRLAKRPWYTTGRPPVNFRAIWSPFDTPTVNRGTVKASCVLQPNTPPKRPNNPSKPLPCPPSSDHNRVVKNYTPFGHSYLLLAINM